MDTAKQKVVDLANYRNKPKVMRCNSIVPGMDPDLINTFEFQPCVLCEIPCEDGGDTCFALSIILDLVSEPDLDKLLENLGHLRKMFSYVEYYVPKEKE